MPSRDTFCRCTIKLIKLIKLVVECQAQFEYYLPHMSAYDYQQDIQEPETYVNELHLGAYKVRIPHSIISTQGTVNKNCDCQNIQ